MVLPNIIKGFWKNIQRTQESYKDFQLEEEAQAFRDGYERALKQFSQSAQDQLNKCIEDLNIKFETCMKSSFSVEPLGYDMITCKPIGSIRTIKIPKYGILIKVYPEKEYFKIIDDMIIGKIQE